MTGYLLDENLPARLKRPTLMGVHHVSRLGRSLSDTAIWNHATTQDLVIISQDVDFADRMLISTPPPRVIHIRTGNLTFARLNETLAAIWPDVEARLPASRLVNVFSDRIEAVS